MSTFEVRSGRDLGAAVGAARRAAGISRIEAAAIGGISPDYLAKIENGRTSSLLEHELRILRRLGARIVIELPNSGSDNG